MISNNNNPSIAGSSLPLSITSGVSSESTAPTVGQYGFVSTHCSYGFRCPDPGARLDYRVWQIYSITRISTLVTAALGLVGVDIINGINCQVRMFHIGFIWALIGHDPKVKVVFELVSKPLRCTQSQEKQCITPPFSGL